MKASKVSNVNVIKYLGKGIMNEPDLVAVEEPLEIRIGYGALQGRQQSSISVTMRTPGNDFELAVGFLFTEGVISNYDDVESVKYCEDLGKEDQKGNVVRVELKPDVKIELERLQKHFYTTSSCGICGKTSIEAVSVSCAIIKNSDLKILDRLIMQAPDLLLNAQKVFEHTGGIHAAGLFDFEGNLQLVREDVGRHNALDKLIGACVIIEALPLDQHFVLVSGRASFELVQKVLIAGVPILAAVGAPSSLAVKLAQEMNLTLLGFVRQNNINIYTGADRIIPQQLVNSKSSP